jgi:hypothetical protein
MFGSKTVFVLGAGASSEAGLPTGAGLIPILRNKLNFKHEMGVRQIGGDPSLFEALRRNAVFTSQDVNLYSEAGRKIYSGLPLANSIDDFLDMHRDDKFIQACGKLAIVQSILEAERSSKLFFDHRELRNLDIDKGFQNKRQVAYSKTFPLFRSTTIAALNSSCFRPFNSLTTSTQRPRTNYAMLSEFAIRMGQ